MRFLISKGKHQLALMVLLASVAMSMPAWSQYGEYILKAAFMEKFTHFIEWPNATKNVFNVCVIGENPFKGTLKKLASSSRIKSKPTKFTTIDNIDSISNCNILFISSSKRTSINQILNSVRGQPVLTISDTPGFAQQGVIINFLRNKDNNIQFEINHRMAQNVGLKISSRLLKLAIPTSSSISIESEKK